MNLRVGAKIDKNSWMYAGIVLSWLLCILYFNPRLFAVIEPDDTSGAKVVYFVFVLFMNLFWFYGLFHCFFLIHKIFNNGKSFSCCNTEAPTVAILYTTRNDFKEDALSSCLKQTYQNSHVYVLDDSTVDKYKSVIDKFQLANSERATVIRRIDRKGYKAGNLNNALRHHIKDCKYFAVIDADEIIPPDFLEKLVPYFDKDEALAFVQANHKENPQQPSSFATDLAPGIDFHWDVYQPPRNDCGFVIFYGHGALIRRDVWERVGGFPELVSEDLAFSARARLCGFKGLFVREVVCYEDFPETYPQFRKRYEKWVKGACEYLHKEFLPFVLSNRVSIPEKMDVFFSCFSLFIPFLFLIYVFVANAAIPALLSEKQMQSVVIFGRSYELFPVFFMEPRFKSLWSFDFCMMTLISMFSPIFCYIGSLFAQPGKILKLLFKSAVPYISLITVSTLGVLTYLLTRRVVFLTTGDKETPDEAILSDIGGLLMRITSNHPVVFFIEFILGIALTYIAVRTTNFAVLTISSCLILSPFVARYGWDNKIISALTALPLLFILMTFSSIGMGFMGIQGFSLFFLTLHF